MNQKHANSRSTVAPDPVGVAQENASSRCQHRFANGTRCRLRIPDADSLFCPRHAQLPENQREAADLSATLTADLAEFKSAVPINDFLSRLLVLLAQNRISARRAAVLAYITNQLLRTLPAIERELEPQSSEDAATGFIVDIPRPNRTPTSEPS